MIISSTVIAGASVTAPTRLPARQLLANLLSKRSLPASLALSIAIALLLAASASKTLAAIPQDQSQASAPQQEPKPVPLEPGKPLERELKGGEKHTYEIRAQSGQFLHAVVEQFGIDVALILFSPDGKPIASMDSPNGNFGPEKISTIAVASGIYRLEVASGSKNVPAGRYRVTVDPIRMPSDKDRARVIAERTFFEATLLFEEASINSLHAANQKYSAALALWRAAGDEYEEALTQDLIGYTWINFAENQKALEDCTRALALFRALGDWSGQEQALDCIGSAYNNLGEPQNALD